MDIERIMEQHNKGIRFYIFGAGKHAESIFRFLQENRIPVHGFVVSEMTDNPETLFGIPVMDIRDFSKISPNLPDHMILVSITKSSIHYKSVFERLVQNQIHNLAFLTDDFIKDIQLKLLQKTFEKELITFFDEDSIYYLAEEVPVESYHKIMAMKGKDREEYHWRIGRSFTENRTAGKISDFFVSKTALEEFEEQYGTYQILRNLKKGDSAGKPSCSVYMAHSHADKIKLHGNWANWIIPIQVGSALTVPANWEEVRDNLGDNISEKNGNYSECTALYWMWKHAPRTDYIGLCHYRRHFDLSEEDFSKLEENQMDVLVTAPTFVAEGIWSFFSSLTPKTDIEMLLKAIASVQPEYLSVTENFFKARFFPPCNLSIMKYELFQEYAAFAFSVTFEIEHFYEEMGISRKDRYMGFLVECLLGIFLMHNKGRLKVAYTDMVFYS